MQLWGVIGSFLTITVLYLKYDLIVLGAGDSANFDLTGDSNFAFGYQLYFLGKFASGYRSELALVDPWFELAAFSWNCGKIICLCFLKILILPDDTLLAELELELT